MESPYIPGITLDLKNKTSQTYAIKGIKPTFIAPKESKRINLSLDRTGYSGKKDLIIKQTDLELFYKNEKKLKIAFVWKYDTTLDHYIFTVVLFDSASKLITSDSQEGYLQKEIHRAITGKPTYLVNVITEGDNLEKSTIHITASVK